MCKNIDEIPEFLLWLKRDEAALKIVNTRVGLIFFKPKKDEDQDLNICSCCCQTVLSQGI
jgi:hypothetical protein